ncbi:MAG: hypothetical protein IKU67_05210 [Firmicutes bacterium]|nr:hypothetical protein [Bacillota bacterium]
MAKILTFDDLYKFFVEQNKNVNFNAKETKTPIVVSVPGVFAKEDDSMPGLLKLKLKVCHTELNRNGSFISKDNMEKGMPTLKYRPILAHIHELEDGTKDFYAHNIEVVENKDGESEINYIEKQVGCFTADDPWLEYDKEMDKTYVMAYSVIPEQYTEAADIIRRKNGTKVSCELVINELSYNAKEKYLDLTDFYFSGCTLLGCDDEGNEIGEGMLGARADIADFCHKEPVFTYQDKLIEVLEKLNVTLKGFDKNSEEGGDEEMDNFENEVVEEVVETEVEEAVVETNEVEETVVETNETEETEVVEETETEETSTSEDGDEVQEEFEETPVEEKFTKIFTVELSHEDIHSALYRLIGQYEEEDNEYFYIRNVYDNYFVMQGWAYGKLYKVGYSIDGESVALAGERQEVFELIVTESEKIALEKMRENYDSLVKYKEDTESAALQAKKDAVFADEKYANVVNTNAFKKLVENSKDYSVEECAQKADEILDDFSSFAVNFAAVDEIKKPGTLGLNFNAKPSKKKSAYGGLFEKDE